MVDNRLPEDTLFLVFEPDYRTYGEDLEAKELANSSLMFYFVFIFTIIYIYMPGFSFLTNVTAAAF